MHNCIKKNRSFWRNKNFQKNRFYINCILKSSYFYFKNDHFVWFICKKKVYFLQFKFAALLMFRALLDWLLLNGTINPIVRRIEDIQPLGNMVHVHKIYCYLIVRHNILLSHHKIYCKLIIWYIINKLSSVNGEAVIVDFNSRFFVYR